MGRLVKRVGRLVPREVWDAGAEAQRTLNAARLEAERLIGQARGEAAAIHEEARLAGLRAGKEEAETAFTTLLLAARTDAERVRARAIPAARTLAVRMAEKIVRQVVQLEPAVLLQIVTHALEAARARTGVVTLRVHPDDLAVLEEARPDMMARLGSATDLLMVPDETVGRAGCVVETPIGRLDARLTTQLLALEKAVYGGADLVADLAGDPETPAGARRG